MSIFLMEDRPAYGNHVFGTSLDFFPQRFSRYRNNMLFRINRRENTGGSPYDTIEVIYMGGYGDSL